MFAKLKKSWQEFLVRMAKENQEQYGSKRMDCCDLNKKEE